MQYEILGPQLVIADFDGAFYPSYAKFCLRNRLSTKPERALWSSTLVDGTSAWEKWCEYEEPEWVNGVPHWVLVPKETTKVFTVDTIDDAWELPTMPIGRYKQVDFCQLARDGYDGLHLTENGAAELHWDTDSLGFDFNAWDCESTVWFNADWIRDYCRLEDF